MPVRPLKLASLSTAALLLTLAGCYTTPAQFFGFPSGEAGSRISTTSPLTGATLEPKFSAAVYRYLDASSADIYLTDLPVSRLADLGDGLAGLNGSVLHIHLFLVPTAGQTPIDPTACSAAVRQFIFAGGEPNQGPILGVYSGGAFVTPAGDGPGKPALSGLIQGGSVRLMQADPGFVDKLGPSEVEGRFSASLDDAAARAIADRLAMVAAKVPAYAPPADDAMKSAMEQARPARHADAAPANTGASH